MIIKGSTIINRLCFVLCRIMSIVKYSANAPPEIANKNSAFSDTLLFFRIADFLSEKVISELTKEIKIKYKIKNGNLIQNIITKKL